MSASALSSQSARIRDGIGREELDRELERRSGRWTVSDGRGPVIVAVDEEGALRAATWLAERAATVTVVAPSGKKWTL